MSSPAMTLQAALRRQYHASLAMLQEAIGACPDELWVSVEYLNPFWQVTYHTLYYTDLYLQPSESDFVPWEHHRPGLHRFETGSDASSPVTPYSVAEMTAYCHRCQDTVDGAVDRLDLAASESGFSWYRLPKLEHQLVNLRHLQHHTGQLADRLRQATGQSVQWVGGDEEPSRG